MNKSWNTEKTYLEATYSGTPFNGRPLNETQFKLFRVMAVPLTGRPVYRPFGPVNEEGHTPVTGQNGRYTEEDMPRLPAVHMDGKRGTTVRLILIVF